MVEINTISHLTREHIGQKPDEGVKDASRRPAAHCPPAIVITTSDEHDADALSNSPINNDDLGATRCTSNTPVGNGDVLNRNLRQELESVKEVAREHKLLCMLRYSEVTKEMERLQNEFVGQDICYDPDILCRRIGARGTPRVRVSDRSPRAAAFPSPRHAAGDADACIHPHPPANLPLISLNLFVVTFINLW